MTHCTSVTVALRLLCKAGNATLTTVPSMKAMLDPRIVAASVQRRCVWPQLVAAALRELARVSSHGDLSRFILDGTHASGVLSQLRQARQRRAYRTVNVATLTPAAKLSKENAARL